MGGFTRRRAAGPDTGIQGEAVIRKLILPGLIVAAGVAAIALIAMTRPHPEADQAALEKLAARPMAADFNPRLRKLEGADFDSPFNFAWRLDYADILGLRAGGERATLKGEFGLV